MLGIQQSGAFRRGDPVIQGYTRRARGYIGTVEGASFNFDSGGVGGEVTQVQRAGLVSVFVQAAILSVSGGNPLQGYGYLYDTGTAILTSGLGQILKAFLGGTIESYSAAGETQWNPANAGRARMWHEFIGTRIRSWGDAHLMKDETYAPGGPVTVAGLVRPSSNPFYGKIGAFPRAAMWRRRDIEVVYGPALGTVRATFPNGDVVVAALDDQGLGLILVPDYVQFPARVVYEFRTAGGIVVSVLPIVDAGGGDVVGARLPLLAPVPDPNARAWWRIQITAQSGIYAVAVAELELRATPGGAAQSGGAAFSRSQYSSYGPTQAFDGLASTFWSAAAAVPPADWLGIHFNKARPVSEIAIRARPDQSGEGPRDFDVQRSSDGVTWEVVWSVTGQINWTAGQLRVFTKP